LNPEILASAPPDTSKRKISLSVAPLMIVSIPPYPLRRNVSSPPPLRIVSLAVSL
jgi:hypothetical protein